MTPKAFQNSSIQAVLRAFRSEKAARRFLVADEPGLGKTVVARGVLDKMAAKKGPLTVLYVCSSQAIATQNVNQLLGGMSSADRAHARAAADRPGLLPLVAAPTHDTLRIYSLTPGTAFSSGKRGSSGGRKKERAFACALLEHEAGIALEWLRECLGKQAADFGDRVADIKRELAQRLKANDRALHGFMLEFHKLLAMSLTDHRVAGNHRKLRQVFDKAGKHQVATVTTLCRNCLAAAALTRLKPGLIIFDEFQRFRDLLTDEPVDHAGGAVTVAEHRLMSVLTGSAAECRLLLLSATPYEALRQAVSTAKKHPAGAVASKSTQTRSDEDFYRLLGFLWGNMPRRKQEAVLEVRECFAIRDAEIRRGAPESKEALEARVRLTQLLRSVMCRTERPPQSEVDSVPTPQMLPLTTSDLRGFKSFANWLTRDSSKHAHWAVPLWSSVPMPAQSLGKRYVCWSEAPAKLPRAELSGEHLKNWRTPAEWSNPKVRSLLQVMPPSCLSMPWVRPTHVWWPLAGGWTQPGVPSADGPDPVDGKVLVFSRFSAVPGALSAVMSFTLEAHLHGRSPEAAPSYKAGAKPSFPRGGASPAMFQLFFVSHCLVGLDPLADGIPRSEAAAKQTIARQLRQALEARGIQVRRRLKRKSKIGLESWLIHLAMRAAQDEAPDWPQARAAWIDALLEIEGSDKVNFRSVSQILDTWLAKLPNDLIEIDEHAEFWPLVQLALDSPGVVLVRAIRRHWTAVQLDGPAEEGKKKAKSDTPRLILQRLALGGLRRYLDKPWFAAAFKSRSAKTFPEALRRAVVAGNLESVLDEHFWFVSATNGESWPSRLATLRSSLDLPTGRTLLHVGDKGSKNKQKAKTRVRCHVALPLHQAKEDVESKRGRAAEEEPRPDQVRHAFNTPFWPMVLTTTSVGQEGLDFHPWCRTVAHWDPAPGPVELEQREGRISRYGGLAIRRALGRHALCVPEASTRGSPWCAIADRAENNLKDPSEMMPWWSAPGASTLHLYLHAAGSREFAQRELLERRRATYRMVLGASEPYWLLDELDATAKLDRDAVLKSSLQLGAWHLEHLDMIVGIPSRPRK